MKEDATLFILMHSKQDWQHKLGVLDVDEFLDWLWHQDLIAVEDVSVWLEQKIEEFKSL